MSASVSDPAGWVEWTRSRVPSQTKEGSVARPLVLAVGSETVDGQELVLVLCESVCERVKGCEKRKRSVILSALLSRHEDSCWTGALVD